MGPLTPLHRPAKFYLNLKKYIRDVRLPYGSREGLGYPIIFSYIYREADWVVWGGASHWPIVVSLAGKSTGDAIGIANSEAMSTCVVVEVGNAMVNTTVNIPHIITPSTYTSPLGYLHIW